jgi:hypothetical protein
VKDAPELNKFIFASESCLPIVPLDECMERFYEENNHNNHKTNKNSSWMAAKNKANNGFAQQKQFEVVGSRIPMEFVWKADQWVMISRFHALEVVELIDRLKTQTRKEVIESPLFDLFQGTNASDELFFPTVTTILGHQFIEDSTAITTTSEKEEKNVIVKKRLTYVDWSDNGRSPKTFQPFDPITLAAMKKAREEQKTLFMRKIQCKSFLDNRLPVEEKLALFRRWYELIYQESPSVPSEMIAFVRDTLLSSSFSQSIESEDALESNPHKKRKI